MLINVEGQDTNYILDDDDASFLIDSVAKWWTDWYSNAENHRKQRENVIEALIHNSTINATTASQDQKSKYIYLPQVWEQFHTYKANLWKGNFSAYDTLLDVQGKDPESQQQAPAHKAMVLSLCKEMDMPIIFDEIMDSWLIDGEVTCFVYWFTDLTKVRRKITQDIPQLDGTVIPQEQYTEEDRVVYDGPKTKILDPNNFVCDPTKTDKDNWNQCIKIVRDFVTFYDIVSNQVYELDQDTIDYLYNSAGSGDKNKDKENYKPTDVEGANDNSLIEIMEVWGDIPLQFDIDNLEKPLVLKNWLLTIANRSRIIRSEPNPYVTNPFVRGLYMSDGYGRGISPLSPTIPLNMIASDFINMQMAAIALIINKPFLAPKNSMGQSINIFPGAIIEFDAAKLQNTFMPQPLDFTGALAPLDFISLIQNNIEASTGVYKYMSGAQDNRTRSATESNYLVQGQNTRLGKEIAMLNLKVTTPLFKKIAEVYINNSFDETQVPTGQPDQPFININDDVKFGNYSFFYGSQETIMEAESKFKEVMEILMNFQNNPQVMANIQWDVLLTKWLNRKNIEFANEIVKTDALTQFLSLFPLEQQQGIRDMMAQEGQNYMMQMQQQQALQEQQMNGGINGGLQNAGGSQGPETYSPQDANLSAYIQTPQGGISGGGSPAYQ